MLRRYFSTLRRQADPGLQLRPIATGSESELPRCVEVLEKRLVLSATINGANAFFELRIGAITIVPRHDLEQLDIAEDVNDNGVVRSDTTSLTITGKFDLGGNSNPNNTTHDTLTIRTTGLAVNPSTTVNNNNGEFTLSVPVGGASSLDFGLEMIRENSGGMILGPIPVRNDSLVGDPPLMASIRINGKPVANDGTSAIFRDTRALISLDVNDGDPSETEPLTVEIRSLPEGTLFRKSGAVFTALGVGDTVNLTAGQQLFYEPPTGETGGQVSPNTFTFRVNDGTENSDIATQTLNVVDPPEGRPVLDPADDTGRDEPAGPPVTPQLQINGQDVDKVTSVQTGLTFSGDAGGATTVTLVARDVNSPGVDFATVGTSISGGTYTGTFGTMFPEGTYNVFARVEVAGADPLETEAVRLNIDVTPPPAPGGTLTSSFNLVDGVPVTTDTTPSFSFPTTEFNARVNIDRTQGGVTVMPGPLDPAVNQRVETFIEATDLGDGTYEYAFKQEDLAGNDPPTVTTIVIDSTAPVLTNLAVEGALNSDPLLAITRNDRPEFTFDVTEQRFAAIDHDVLIQLLDEADMEIGQSLFTIASGPDGNVTTPVTLQPNASLPLGQQKLTIRITDAAGNVTDQELTLAVIDVLPPTIGAPATPVFSETFFHGAKLIQAAAMDDTSIVVDQDIPTGFTINVHQKSFIVGGTTAVTGGFQLDLLDSMTGMSTELGEDLEAGQKLQWLQTWTMSLDKTTQTYWFAMEDGHRMGQFDPATGNLDVFDVNFDPGDGASTTDPHGVFFDFDSHVTPRVWFTYRNANRDGDTPEAVDDTGNPADDVGLNRVAYIDLATVDRMSHTVDLVTLDFSEIDFDLPGVPDDEQVVQELHAVFVDKRGHVWLTAQNSAVLIELDFDQPNSATNVPSINSDQARVIVHKLPDGLADPDAMTGEPGFLPHGVATSVDERTGETYVFFANGNFRGSPEKAGAIVVLKPGTAASGGGTGTQDEWFEIDITAVLASEGRMTANPLFLDFDDNETPGFPEDDRIIVPYLGGLGSRDETHGTVRSLDTRALITAIREGTTTANDLNTTTMLKLTSTEIEKYPDPSTDFELTGPVHSFNDRAGNTFFVDALSSIGRFNFTDPELTTTEFDVPITGYTSDVFEVQRTLDSVSIPWDSETTQIVPATQEANTDRSQTDATDLYHLAQPSQTNPARGNGAFRGVINATNVVVGALSQSDHLSRTVFAETARRQMAVIQAPGELPEGVLVEGRMAFQVLRNGSVVMTHRDHGTILDEQVNLTREIALAQPATDINDLLFASDPSAVVDGDDNVHVFGRTVSGMIAHYRMDGVTGDWTAANFAAPADGVLPGDPQAFVDSRGDVGVLITQSVLVGQEIEGHLLLYRADGSGFSDLTALAGVTDPAEFIFGNPDIIEDGDDFYAYGVNMRGDVVEYRFDSTDLMPATVDAGILNRSPGEDGRDTNIFQSVTAVLRDGERHIFGNDGNSRLVHLTVTDDASRSVSAENVTALTAPTATGYFDFQQDFAARVYSEISVLVSDDEEQFFVYGTNGADLVLFVFNNDAPVGSQWVASNLTNDTTKGNGEATGQSRVPGNNVFGSPDAYITENGDRHILQINAEGEVVEFHFRRNQDLFVTNNINLATGNRVQDLAALNMNRPPVLVLPGDPVITQPNADPVLIGESASVSATDPASLDGAILIIRTASAVPGDLLSLRTDPDGGFSVAGMNVLFNGTGFGTFTGGMDADPLTVTLNGSATLESVQALLRNTTFETIGSLGSRAVEVLLTDVNMVDSSTSAVPVQVTDPADPLNPLDGMMVT